MSVTNNKSSFLKIWSVIGHACYTLLATYANTRHVKSILRNFTWSSLVEIMKEIGRVSS